MNMNNCFLPQLCFFRCSALACDENMVVTLQASHVKYSNCAILIGWSAPVIGRPEPCFVPLVAKLVLVHTHTNLLVSPCSTGWSSVSKFSYYADSSKLNGAGNSPSSFYTIRINLSQTSICISSRKWSADPELHSQICVLSSSAAFRVACHVDPS